VLLRSHRRLCFLVALPYEVKPSVFVSRSWTMGKQAQILVFFFECIRINNSYSHHKKEKKKKLKI
jgi:hypothetical protein